MLIRTQVGRLCKCTKCGKTRDEGHDWDGCKCKVCGATRKTEKATDWKPTNPRLASNQPISSLKRVFAFTSGDGNSIMKDPVAVGTLMDTVGGSIDMVIGKVHFDVIARTDVGAQIERTGQFPEIAWTAMSKIDSKSTSDALDGLYKTCIRPFHNPQTHENGCFVLLYAK